MAFIPMSGVDKELTLYTTYTLGTSASSSYTMPKDGYVFASMNLNFSSSGYVRLALNGSYLVNKTAKGSYWVWSKLKIGDIVSWQQNSSYASQISIYYDE